MIALLLAAAAATAAASPAPGRYSAPVAKYSDSWIEPYFDWPEGAVQQGTYTAVSFELTVNPYGGIVGCKVTNIVGREGMGELTCRLLRVRARFDPARDPSGKRLHGVYRNTIVWWAQKDSQTRWRPPEYAQYKVTVDRLPPDAETRTAYIQFFVDAGGQASGCSPEGKERRELAAIACERLGPVFKSEPAHDRRGRAVDSVQDAKVELAPR